MNLTELVGLATEKGVFVTLFIFLLLYILSENKKREENQRDLYIKLSRSLDEARDNIKSIEEKIKNIDNSQNNLSKDFMKLQYMLNNIETLLSSQMGFKRNKDRK